VLVRDMKSSISVGSSRSAAIFKRTMAVFSGAKSGSEATTLLVIGKRYGWHTYAVQS
jgi:hypothetical protein